MTLINFFFLFYVALTLIVYHSVNRSAGKWLLLVASYFFYAVFEPLYVLLPLASTIIDYFCAKRISTESSKSRQKRWLIISILLNIGLLAFFKYADFLLDNLGFVLTLFEIKTPTSLGLLLPIGISFYTFQSMSYTIDVYRQKIKPEPSFTNFAVYVVYFPQLIAGPIERTKDLLPQLVDKKPISREDIRYGLLRITIGLAKKLVIADRLALSADIVFANPANFSSIEIIFAVLCFSFQLFLDFSAYTDIAIGVSRLFGIRLSENFNFPFLAKSPSDFWSRWHITLTNWFRDYVFNSMGGFKMDAQLASFMRIVFVMTLVGFWHGAGWSFIIFGTLSGLSVGFHFYYLLFRRKFSKKLPFLRKEIPGFIANFLMIINISFIMIFFRADNFTHSINIIQGITVGTHNWSAPFTVPLILLLSVWATHNFLGIRKIDVCKQSGIQLSTTLILGVIALIVLLAVESSDPFIYFQF